MTWKKLLFKIYRRGIISSINWWYDQWGEKSFVVILSLFIGAIAACAAAVLHVLVVRLEEFGIWLATVPKQIHENAWLLVFLVLPMIGMLLSFLVQRYFGGTRYAKSLSPLILSLSRKRTKIPFSETVTHLFSSGFAVGLGGSAGLEAPSVLTGAAIGANSGSFFRVDRRLRSLLVGCGSASAISAIFGSPIAGVLFTAEVLLPDFTVSSLIPMMMSSAVAAVVSHVIMGPNQFFLAINAPWRTDAIPYYFLCGIICALVGVYVIKAAYFIGDRLKRRFRNPWSRLFFGGTILSVLLFMFPLLRGQGYLFIEKLFAGDTQSIINSASIVAVLPSNIWLFFIIVLLVILLKVVASVLTVDAGGDGGIFAPSMFIGAFTGFGFARLINMSGLVALQEYNFVAVGMCGVFTAVLRAPLTGIFLIAEVTGGYVLLVPLMIVSAVAYLVARFFEPFSIYRKALSENNLLPDNRDQTMLSRLTVKLNYRKDFQVLSPRDQLVQVIKVVDDEPQEVFAVVDVEGHLQGVVFLDKILTAMLHPEEYNHLLVFDLMESPRLVLSENDDLSKAMAAFDEFKVKYLPVCNEDGKYLGFVDKTPIFAKYRNMVKESDSF